MAHSPRVQKRSLGIQPDLQRAGPFRVGSGILLPSTGAAPCRHRPRHFPPSAPGQKQARPFPSLDSVWLSQSFPFLPLVPSLWLWGFTLHPARLSPSNTDTTFLGTLSCPPIIPAAGSCQSSSRHQAGTLCSACPPPSTKPTAVDGTSILIATPREASRPNPHPA